jgi:hypothetical protein
MNIEQYPITSGSSHLLYKFHSIGPKGIIKKIVTYSKINDNFYNLSFGDEDEINGSLNDQVISDNNDSKKVLITDAFTALQFVNHYPVVEILIIGSSMSRTRLYQMAINQNFEEIDKLFDLKGLRNGEWGKFKKGINFDAFLIKKKVKNL